MAKKYLDLMQPIKEYSAEDLRRILKGQNKAQLLRTIILNEKKFLRVDYDRSLRGFWYSTVKPTLDKLGLLTEKDSTEDALTRWDAELSRNLADLVRLGEVTYKDLRIVDTSRQRFTPANAYHVVDRESYGYQVTAAPYPNIIISTEKDTVYSIIADIASFFGCSCISGKGQNSLAAMEDLLRKMGAGDEPVYIITLTDYDPAGYYIADTFFIQVRDLQKSLGIRRRVSIKRIGITPDQLTHNEVRANWYTPKAANLDKWMQQTGGIYGQAKGLELDALEPDRIRGIFLDQLRGYVDPERYVEFIKRAYLQRMILDVMRDNVVDIVGQVVQAYLPSVKLLNVDLFDLAGTGLRYIPVENLCLTDQENEIRKMVLNCFA